MIKQFFQKPHGVGTALNIYMFRPDRIVHAAKLLASDQRYVAARLRNILYQVIHPGRPWLTQPAIAFLMTWLKPDMTGFEWGSGKSTLWLARRCAKLVSVEDDSEWFARVRHKVERLGVDYCLIPTSAGCDEYAGRIAEYPDGHFDFILVDGSCRDRCVELASRKVRKGGIVVLDNADLGYDVSALAGFTRIATDNGVWRTDIYIRP